VQTVGGWIKTAVKRDRCGHAFGQFRRVGAIGHEAAPFEFFQDAHAGRLNCQRANANFQLVQIVLVLLLVLVLDFIAGFDYEDDDAEDENASARTLDFGLRALDFNHNLGSVLFKKGRVDEAIAYFQKSLAVQPDSVLARNHLGTARLLKGQEREALIQFQKALECNPGDPTAHDNLGLVLCQKGQMDGPLPKQHCPGGRSAPADQVVPSRFSIPQHRPNGSCSRSQSTLTRHTRILCPTSPTALGSCPVSS
jgi:tetratricopeptide (TPR) repeat protein